MSKDIFTLHDDTGGHIDVDAGGDQEVWLVAPGRGWNLEVDLMDDLVPLDALIGALLRFRGRAVKRLEERRKT